jgi:hypothetical protein
VQGEETAQTPDLFKRRSFLRSAGLATASTAVLLSSCEPYLDEILNNVSDDSVKTIIRLAGGDVGVLNYAYTLEQLEAAFYTEAVNNSTVMNDLTSIDRQFFMDLQKHEIIHREFFKAALGKDAIPALKFNFSSINFGNRNQVLQTAKIFEDLGVAAYNGAGELLTKAENLILAGKIVSVEARHASYIREILGYYDPTYADPTLFAGNDVIDTNGLDRAFPPNQVLAAVAPYILPKIDASKLM